MKASIAALVLVGAVTCTKNDAVRTTAKPHDDGPAPKIVGDHNLVRNGDFADGSASPWRVTTTGGAQGEGHVKAGAMCIALAKGGAVAWDAQLRHRALDLADGHTYAVEFVAWADRTTKARPRVGRAGPPYEEYWASEVELGRDKKRFRGHFRKRGHDDAAELTFQIGGPLAGKGAVEVCIDAIVLADPRFDPPPPPSWMTAPRIRVNQVGYFPKRTKHAIWKTGTAESAKWTLVDREGKTVAEGETVPLGEDRSSGDAVQLVDFSEVQRSGRGFELVIGDDRSDPFAIEDDIYAQLRRDALAYFYHNRSGIAIEMPFAGDPKWTRGVGHPGDARVECLPALRCQGTFDASGGWYDAGDHGKYVVNAGITLWTLQNAWEWAQHHGKATANLGDGTLAIPERKNGVPDLLDEARWELELLLRLQKRKGQWAGMVFHKLHEETWTSIPHGPHEAKETRFLHRPSTAATLDFAAVVAQAARIHRTIDPAFADRCLAAAERAWKAAETHPALFAPGSDNVGGGPYEDSDVSDERYWAAVELYVTTGKDVYRKALASSKHYLAMPGPGAEHGNAFAPMTWQKVEALGTITLALVPNELAPGEIEKARARIVDVAAAIREIVERPGYRVPLAPDAGGSLPWGSNSAVLDNMMVLAIAHDLSGDAALLAAVVDGMDYLLGRNPMATSYVSGHGTRTLQNPHHRFWAHQKDESYPPPPPGAVSGGPNTGINDPTAKAAGLAGGPPLKSWIDHIDSWSTNEVAINWNAPLAWTAMWLDERGRAP